MLWNCEATVPVMIAAPGGRTEEIMEFVEFTAKTVDDAITAACRKFLVTSDKLEYEVIEEGSTGFLGFNAKPAKIRAKG